MKTTLKEVFGFGIGLSLVNWAIEFTIMILSFGMITSVAPEPTFLFQLFATSTLMILILDAVGYGILYLVVKWILNKINLLTESKISFKESISFGIGMYLILTIIPMIMLVGLFGMSNILFVLLSIVALVGIGITSIEYAFVKGVLLKMRVI